MNPAIPAGDFGKLKSLVEEELFRSVLPFWLNHAIDDAGGINSCIRDDGILVSRDKWLWSQLRAVWVFSKLHNRFGGGPWLELADSIYRFAATHGWDEREGGWRLLVSWEGKPLRGCESIYADCFAIYGFAEFYRATGDKSAAELARKTADRALERLVMPAHLVPTWPYPTPEGLRVHGTPFWFSFALWELGQALDDDRYRDASSAMSDDVFANFHRRDRDVILERIREDNSEAPAPLGTAIVPGHVIEDMWFQIHIARDKGDNARIAEACRLIKRHAQIGWDAEYGGLFLGVDADGREEVGWSHADTKLWWPQTEALYAMLLAYERTGDGEFLDWYRRVHEYSFSRYPVPGHGEWTQKLDRRGRPITEVVALPVKDPFHLPRALIYCIDVLERLQHAS